MSAARCRPSLSTKVTDRASSGPGRRTGRPSGSAHVSYRGSQYARLTVGSRSARDSGSGELGGRRLGAQLEQQVADGRASQAGVQHRQQEDERRQTDDHEHRALDGQERIQRDGEGLDEQEHRGQHERQGERVHQHLDRRPERPGGGGAAAQHGHEPDQSRPAITTSWRRRRCAASLRSVGDRDRVVRVEASQHQADDVEQRHRVRGADDALAPAAQSPGREREEDMHEEREREEVERRADRGDGGWRSPRRRTTATCPVPRRSSGARTGSPACSTRRPAHRARREGSARRAARSERPDPCRHGRCRAAGGSRRRFRRSRRRQWPGSGGGAVSPGAPTQPSTRT